MKLLHFSFILVGFLNLAAEGAQAGDKDLRAEFKRPDRIIFPVDAPYSPQIAALGKKLFFDPRLSGAQNMSCATCHNPSFGWETPAKRAIGANNALLSRHAPTIENLAEADLLYWDGRASSLERQALSPITNPQEMNATIDEVVARLSGIDGYRKWFERLFPKDGVSEKSILRSIATFERTVRSGWAPFDAWVEGDDHALEPAARRGLDFFVGKGGCAACHSGWSLTDHEFHDIGLATSDLGRGAIEPNNPAMRHAFKTPSLRNVARRAPYTHHGELATLEDVVDHYASGGVARSSRSPRIGPMPITPQERDDLIAFLEALTTRDEPVSAPTLPAE